MTKEQSAAVKAFHEAVQKAHDRFTKARRQGGFAASEAFMLELELFNALRAFELEWGKASMEGDEAPVRATIGVSVAAFAAKLKAKADWWKEIKNENHSLASAVAAALSEVSIALLEAQKEAPCVHDWICADGPFVKCKKCGKLDRFDDRRAPDQASCDHEWVCPSAKYFSPHVTSEDAYKPMVTCRKCGLEARLADRL